MRALALLALAACGGRGSPGPAQPSAADRIEILAGDLSLVPPIAAKLEPNRADSIMAAPPSPVSQAVVRMKDGGHHVTAIFRRTWEACAPDPATTIRQYTNAWRTKDGDVTLTSLTTSGGLAATIYLPTKPRRRGDITSLGSILVCAGASGLVSANVMVEGDDLAAARRFTTALASSLAAGSRPTVTSARQVQVEGCSETFAIDAPESFAAYEEVGADFSVFRFQKVSSAEDDPSFAIYVGHHPTQFAPATATTIELPNARGVLRWEDDKGVHLERVVDKGGCIVHAFAVGPPAAEPVLRALIAFRPR